MSRPGLSREHTRMIEELPSNWKIDFDRHVFDYMLYELHRYPNCEEGGKYIGYIEAHEHNTGHRRTRTITVTDFLPGGPNAKRTAVEFLPDGDFQEDLFRRAETRDRAIEHLGTWHSHHCNGLRQLSEGDITGYFKTIRKPAYRPDVFISSLVKNIPRNSHDTDWIDHFLFVRNDDNFYRITSHINLVDAPSSFGDITGHSVQAQSAAHSTLWYETDAGRQALAEDRRFFATHFDANVRATRKEGIITITSERGMSFMAVSYPAIPTDREIKIEIGLSSRVILQLVCDYSHRAAAYAASLEALKHISSSLIA